MWMVVCDGHMQLPATTLSTKGFNTRWQQLPEQSEQLKREKLELGAALLQLLKEAAQRCPGAILEPMVNGNSRYAQELAGFLLLGLQDAKELKPLLYSTAAWAALLEAAAQASAVAALPVAQILQRILWSVARMDYNDIQSQKILGEVRAAWWWSKATMGFRGL
eukprot:Skav211364  [mRNA]  locus=scaffold677:638462:650216:- [translate_table: standard]